MMRSFSRLALPLSAALLLTACAAGNAVINHDTLDVQTHMSETVFLDPVPPSAKTIYVSARNTSDHPEVDLRNPLIQAMTARGYQVVQDPNLAHYMLRINVLQAGQIDPKDESALMSAGFGQPLLGGLAAGALVGGLTGNAGAGVGTGLAVAAGTALLNSMYKDIAFSVVLDIQLSERPLKGGTVHQTTSTVASQGNYSTDSTSTGRRTGASPQTGSANGSSTSNSKVKNQVVDEEADFKQYQIRQVAYADKVNLKFEEAAPVLVTKLTSSLSNLFE